MADNNQDDVVLPDLQVDNVNAVENMDVDELEGEDHSPPDQFPDPVPDPIVNVVEEAQLVEQGAPEDEQVGMFELIKNCAMTCLNMHKGKDPNSSVDSVPSKSSDDGDAGSNVSNSSRGSSGSNGCGGGDRNGGGGGSGDPSGSGSNGATPSPLMFKDCGGLEKQINFIRTSIIEPLTSKNKDHYKRFGLEPPKGIIFHGSPGTGKTRLALALSNELKAVLGKPVHFIYRKGNDVASKWFGQSSANLRQVFAEAIANKPTVLFFDELDGLCPSRDTANLSQANVSIVTSMLGLMDELPRGDVFVIAASNMINSVDPALRRPGRFDKYLEFLPPSQQGRFDILTIHSESWKTKPSEEQLRGIVLKTVGFTGADLSKLCLDSFDKALSRTISGQLDAGVNFLEMQFDNLSVEEGDWKLALDRMKPSATTVFGSTLYAPSYPVSQHIETLLQANITQLKEMTRAGLPNSATMFAGQVIGDKSGQISVLHIWSDSRSMLENLDEYIISPLFRSENDISDIPKYCLSSDILASTQHRDWPAKVESAFIQAVNSYQPSILYIPNVDEFWTSLEASKLGGAVDLEKHLETLRGSKVLLVTTGSCHPVNLQLKNPLKSVCCTSGGTFNVARPSTEDRAKFFSNLQLPNNVATQNPSEEQKLYMIAMKEKYMTLTEGQAVGSIVSLFDNLQDRLSNPLIVNVDDVIKTMAEVLAFYELQLAAARIDDDRYLTQWSYKRN